MILYICKIWTQMILNIRRVVYMFSSKISTQGTSLGSILRTRWFNLSKLKPTPRTHMLYILITNSVVRYTGKRIAKYHLIKKDIVNIRTSSTRKSRLTKSSTITYSTSRIVHYFKLQEKEGKLLQKNKIK